jgi:hypothetical protein
VCLQLGLEFLRPALAWLPVPEFLLLELVFPQLGLAWLLVLAYLPQELAFLRQELASLRQQEFPQLEPLVFLSSHLQS